MNIKATLHFSNKEAEKELKNQLSLCEETAHDLWIQNFILELSILQNKLPNESKSNLELIAVRRCSKTLNLQV